MKSKTFGLLLIFFVQELAWIAFAAPLPPEIIVQDALKECAWFFAGDECTDCVPPPGWRSLGSETQCPANYSQVEVRGICRGFENSRCCTERHSGASGDCTNLVINNFTKECAFVQDVSNCTLPIGWLNRPENISSAKWVCPLAHIWTSVNCTEHD